MKLKISIVIVFLFNLSTILFGQELNTKDSLDACTITNDFFEWYIDATNKRINSAYQPRFIESEIGYTTLDFKEYFKNLKKYHCSKTFIENERESYTECLKNIEEITIVYFKEQFTDIDQLEEINCDFENYYRWTGGQEPIQGIRILKIEMISNNQIKVTIDYSSEKGESNKIKYWGKNEITLLKIKAKWKINDINL